MKYIGFLVTLLLLLISLSLMGQSRKLSGKVICSDFPSREKSSEHEFWNASKAQIYGNESVLLGVANEDGEFELEISDTIKTIRIIWVAMYPEKFVLNDSCEFLEIILLPDVIYDFVSIKKEKQLRKRDRRVLPKLYKMAYEQGIFKSKEPCKCCEFNLDFD